MIDPDSEDGKYLARLMRDLHNRRTGRVGKRQWRSDAESNEGLRPGLDLLAQYRDGDPPMTEIHAGWKPYVRRFIRMGNLNVAGLSISSTRNRLKLRDFRTAAEGDDNGDTEARDLMRHNRFGITAKEVVDLMLTFGDSYALVTPPGEGDDSRFSLITAEDPRQCITLDNPLTGRPTHGLKLFRDEWDEADLAYLYKPGGVVRIARMVGASSIDTRRFSFNKNKWDWVQRNDDDEWVISDEEPEPLPDGLFPMFHFQNERGKGEFEEHLSTLDRINDKIFNEWWISKIQAFRQRAVKNLPEYREVEGADGETVEEPVPAGFYDNMFLASPDEMWQVPADVDFWESTPVDMNPIITSIQKDLERFAAVKSLPLTTITPDAANGSAEGASLMREEHLELIEDRQDRLGAEWPFVIATAFAFMDDEARSQAEKIEPIWGPTERFSLSQKADAAQKLAGGKPALPTEAIQTDVLQYPPSEVDRLREQQGREMLLAAQAVPAPAPGGTNPPTPGIPTPPAPEPPAVPA